MNQMHISYICELPGDCIVLIIVLKKLLWCCVLHYFVDFNLQREIVNVR